MTALIRTVAPSFYPITLVEAKSHLNLSHSDIDAKLDQFIATATNHLDGIDGVLGKAICQQTWELYRDRFCASIEIPLPPLISVDLVQYIDGSDVLQTMDAADYQVVRGGSLPASIRSSFGVAWPTAKAQPDSIKITFTAGYPEGEIPETIKHAMLLMVSHWNENREAFGPDNFFELPLGVKTLLGRQTIIPLA